MVFFFKFTNYVFVFIDNVWFWLEIQKHVPKCYICICNAYPGSSNFDFVFLRKQCMVWVIVLFFRLHTRTGPKGLQITGITWRTASISPGVADSYGKMATVKTSITLSVKPFCNSCSGQYKLQGTSIIYTVQLFFLFR